MPIAYAMQHFQSLFGHGKSADNNIIWGQQSFKMPKQIFFYLDADIKLTRNSRGITVLLTRMILIKLTRVILMKTGIWEHRGRGEESSRIHQSIKNALILQYVISSMLRSSFSVLNGKWELLYLYNWSFQACKYIRYIKLSRWQSQSTSKMYKALFSTCREQLYIR